MIYVIVEVLKNTNDAAADREYMKDNEQDILLAELMVKVVSIERLLTKLNIISTESLSDEMKKVSDEIMIYVKKNSEAIFGDKDKN